MLLCFLLLIYSLWCWWYSIDSVNVFWICYCFYYFSDFSIFVSSVDIGIIWFFIIVLCLYSIFWTSFVSSTFTVFDVVFRVRCLWVQWFLVYNLCWCFWLFCFHICSIFLKWVFFTDIYRMLLCLLISMGSMWFWWLNVSVIDKFTSVTDVADVYFIMLSQKSVYCFD